MKVVTKFNVLFFIIMMATYHNNCGMTQVTCIFTNTTQFPITFKSFQDDNNKPIEIKNMNIGESITSKIQAKKTVVYDIQANINTYVPQLTTSGLFNIYYDTRRNKFSYEKGSFTEIDPGTQNAILSTVQITNRTILPINVSILLKDTGQARQDPTTPSQAVFYTKLPINGFYSVTDPVDHIVINHAINGYHSHPLSLSSVKSKYNIIDNFGTFTIVAGN